MTTYERVVGGRVVERVTPVLGDHEDTRLGCAALDRAAGADGWRVQGVDDVVPTDPDETGTEDQGEADPPADAKPPKPTAPTRNKDKE